MYYFQLLYTYLFLFYFQGEEVYFQSERLKGVLWQHNAPLHHIMDDKGEEIEIFAKKDEEGLLYWYRRAWTPVCLIGECKLIDIGIYWDFTGDFFGLEVYGEALTKTDHSDFTAEDYQRLIEILENDWSPLREYELSDLVEQPYKESSEVDGTSGATKKEIAEEAVADAVYTTHTIWHLSHVGEKEQLVNLTVNELNNDEALSSYVMQYDQIDDHTGFFLGLFANGELDNDEYLNLLVIRSLTYKGMSKNKSLAFKTLSKCNYSDPYFLQRLIDIYNELPPREKIQALNEFQKINTFPESLFLAIVQNLENQQEWYVLKVFQVMENRSQFKDNLISLATNLTLIDNPQLQSILKKYQ